MGSFFLFLLILLGVASGILFLNKGAVATEIKSLLNQIFEDLKKLTTSLKNLLVYIFDLFNEKEKESNTLESTSSENIDLTSQEKAKGEDYSPQESEKLQNSFQEEKEPEIADDSKQQEDTSIYQRPTLEIESESSSISNKEEKPKIEEPESPDKSLSEQSPSSDIEPKDPDFSSNQMNSNKFSISEPQNNDDLSQPKRENEINQENSTNIN